MLLSYGEERLGVSLSKGRRGPMGCFGRLIVGVLGLFAITFMTIMFGSGGFLFTIGLFAVIAWALSANRD
jgi:hypothetical protein